MKELKRISIFEASVPERIMRVVMVLFGVVFLALGIAFLKLALLGNDPYTGMLFAISDVTGFPYPWLQVLVGLLLLVVEFIWGRHYIGIGTVYNAVCIGFIVDFFYGIIHGSFGDPGSFPYQLLALAAGMIICSFGISMYQQADLGVSPYDSISLIMAERQDRLPYFWCRIITDAVCAIVCFLLGGIVGLGTLVTAFGFGPFVSFFNNIVSNPLIRLSRGEKKGDL